jgi:hypothetical protein
MNSDNNNIHLFTVFHGLDNYNPQNGQKLLLFFCLDEEDLFDIIYNEVDILKKLIKKKNSKFIT